MSTKITTTGIKYEAMNKDKLSTYIQEVCIDARKLKDRIQVACIAIVMHTAKHGDKPTGVKFANDLINGLGQGIQFKALASWFIKFAGAVEGKVTDDSGKDVTAFVDFDLDVIKANFEEAKKTHWATFAPKPEYRGFNLDEKLEQLLKQAADAKALAESDSTATDKVVIDDKRLALLARLAKYSETEMQAMLQAAEAPVNDPLLDMTA